MATSRTMPSGDAVKAALAAAHAKYKDDKTGANASYIPALANVPSDLFGIAVVTADGQVFEVGDSGYCFAIESISKVFSMALAMEEVGPDALHQKVGADPTGLPFNSVIAVELHGGKPLSPLVNAGALSTVSLLPAATPDERWAKLLDGYSRFAGHKLELIDEVYSSEAATNFHNRGIAWLLYSYGTMYSEPMAACDVLPSSVLWRSRPKTWPPWAPRWPPGASTRSPAGEWSQLPTSPTSWPK